MAAAALLAAMAAASLFGSSMGASPSAFVKKTVAAHEIVIFSKSYCPYALSLLLISFS